MDRGIRASTPERGQTLCTAKWCRSAVPYLFIYMNKYGTADRHQLPGDAVVLAVVAGAAPERAVLVVEHDRVDRPGGARVVLELVAAAIEVEPRPVRDG